MNVIQMRRKVYFFLEKLEISRGERISVSVLMCSLLLFSGIYHYREPTYNYNQDHYENLELLFKEKSRQAEEEKRKILARYQPSMGTGSTESETNLEDNGSNQSVQLEVSDVEPERFSGPEIININRATEGQLVALPGIGPAYARRIVEWREENGMFTEKEQLLEIRGIGERRLEQLVPYIEL